MNRWSTSSKRKLDTCVPEIQELFNAVLQKMDCTVIFGHRGEELQNEAYEKGFSKLPWPRSKHNRFPSKAIDIMPYPVDWNDMGRLIEFSKIVKETAEEMSIDIEWGGDWTNFFDGAHWEVK